MNRLGILAKIELLIFIVRFKKGAFTSLGNWFGAWRLRGGASSSLRRYLAVCLPAQGLLGPAVQQRTGQIRIPLRNFGPTFLPFLLYQFYHCFHFLTLEKRPIDTGVQTSIHSILELCVRRPEIKVQVLYSVPMLQYDRHPTRST